MKNILIPFAIVNNKVKNIKNIYKQDECYCLECGEKLILRNGDKNIKHLAHMSNSNCLYRNDYEYEKHGGESYEHKYAKEYIRDNLLYFRQYGNEIIIKDGEFKLGGFKDLKVDKIEIEYRGLKKELDLKNEYIPDLLLRTSDCLIALEIYNKNKKNKALIKDNLIGKNIYVYEIDIRSISVLNFKEIFKNMKLIFSNLECEFNDAMKPIQDKIVECNTLKNTISHKENEITNCKIEINSLEEQLSNNYKNKYYSDRIVNRNKYLEKTIEKLKGKDIENRKCWKKCVKDWYSRNLNFLIDKDIKKCDSDSDEFEILDNFKRFYNGKVGAYSSWGGDEKLKEIADITKIYPKAIKYLGVDNDRFKELVGMISTVNSECNDEGEIILKRIISEDILFIEN